MISRYNGSIDQNYTHHPLRQSTAYKRSIINSMIDEYQSKPIDLRRFLDQSEFLTELQGHNSQLFNFLHRERKQICKKLIDVIIEECPIVTDENYKKYIIQPMTVLEIMALDIGPIMNAFFEDGLSDELFAHLFSYLERSGELPEPQLGNFMKFLQPLMDKNINRVCQFVFTPRHQQTAIMKCLNHIYSAQVINFVIAMFNPESSNRLLGQDKIIKTRVEFIKICFKGFSNLTAPEVLNLMNLIHEIMNRFIESSQDIMTYLVSYQALQTLFDNLNANNIFTSKSAAHILSLISNYYSYSMQNIGIMQQTNSANNQEYNVQLTKQFEQSDFFTVFSINLTTLTSVLDTVIRTKKLGMICFKIIEINDNLIRITNLKLWQEMSRAGLLTRIFKIFFEFPNSNIIHTVIEKMIQYILNRTVSDFHPYWTHQLFVEVKIMDMFSDYLSMNKPNGPIFQMINNFSWFIRELQEKSPNMKQGNHYNQEIIKVFSSSKSWFNCIQVSLMADYPEKYAIVIDKSKSKKQEERKPFIMLRPIEIQEDQVIEPNFDFKPPTIISGFKEPEKEKLIESQKEVVTVPSRKPEFLELRIKTKNALDEDYLREIDSRQLNILPSDYTQAYKNLEQIVEALKEDIPPDETTKLSDDKELIPQEVWINDLSNLSDLPLNYMTNLTRTDAFKVSTMLNSPACSPVHLLRQNSDDEMKLSTDLTNKRRSSAMNSSLKLKSMVDDFSSEFHIASQVNQQQDKVLVQPANMQILKVDEIDMENQEINMKLSISLSNSRSSLGSKRLKIFYRSSLDSQPPSKQASPTMVPHSKSFDCVDMTSSISSNFSVFSTNTEIERKFRRIQLKDKKFLKFIKQIGKKPLIDDTINEELQ